MDSSIFDAIIHKAVAASRGNRKVLIAEAVAMAFLTGLAARVWPLSDAWPLVLAAGSFATGALALMAIGADCGRTSKK